MVLDEKSDLKPTFFAACPSVPELDEFDLGPYPSAKAALQFDPSGDFVRPLDRAYALEDYLVHYTCRCENRKWFEGTPTPWSGGHDLGVIGRVFFLSLFLRRWVASSYHIMGTDQGISSGLYLRGSRRVESGALGICISDSSRLL
ncbi:hypothetical protein I7I53_06716 [Histoplasma capsulatum var. duboisii H88]|uniref:Uncharacterized protein n=1 Tax=Ajellomyces capsulatus (strain H88) TaxID=544711 RepID=A0A8A1LG30_AJEC8|nr:hypothetical protein I7I53_06716 [Histoplasma capsulatum var. duboisii H88]